MSVERLAYSIPEAAEAAGVSETTIRRAYRSGALKRRFVTAKPVILREDLEAWIKAAPTEAAS